MAHASITPINSKLKLQNLNVLGLNAEKNSNKKNFPQTKLKIVKTKLQMVDKDTNILQEDNLKLRSTIAKLQADVTHYKNEFVKSQTELKRRENFFEDLISNEKSEELFHGMGLNIPDIHNISINNSFYPNWQNQSKEFLLIKNIRRKFKEKQKELKLKEDEIQNLKIQMKFTKINEISIENLTLNEEIQKMKTLYDKLLTEASAFVINHKDIEILHASLTNQYKIIDSTQQHLEEMREENNQKTIKIKNLKEKCKNLKRELEMERLIKKSDNELASCNNEKDTEIKELKEKLQFFERELKMKEKFIEKIEDRNAKEIQDKIIELNQIKINLNQINSEMIKKSNLLEEKEKEICLLQSLVEEEKDKFVEFVKIHNRNKINLNIQSIKSHSYAIIPKVEPQNEFIHINSDFNIKKEFDKVTQLITAILQVNKIDYATFKGKVFSELKEEEENNLTEFLTIRLLEVLKLKSQEDKHIIKHYINHINSEFTKDSFTLEKCKEAFDKLFYSFRILSDDEVNVNNKILKNILNPNYTKLQKKFFKKDKNLQAHICYDQIKEILESLQITLETDLFHQMTYLMKLNTSRSLYKMKYLNILNLISNDEENFETDEENLHKSLEIASTQFLTLTKDFDNRIQDIFKHIANHLMTANLSINEFFKDIFTIIYKQEAQNAIHLKLFIEILNEELKLNLDQADSVYLHYKLKYQSNPLNAELIDLDKLKTELKSYGITKENLIEYNINKNNVTPKNNSLNNQFDKNFEFNENIIIEDNISDSLFINNSDNCRNSFLIKNYSNHTNSHRSDASLLILTENKKCRDIICNNDENILYNNIKEHTKILIDDMFSKVLEEYKNKVKQDNYVKSKVFCYEMGTYSPARIFVDEIFSDSLFKIHSINYETKIKSQQDFNEKKWDN